MRNVLEGFIYKSIFPLYHKSRLHDNHTMFFVTQLKVHESLGLSQLQCWPNDDQSVNIYQIYPTE